MGWLTEWKRKRVLERHRAVAVGEMDQLPFHAEPQAPGPVELAHDLEMDPRVGAERRSLLGVDEHHPPRRVAQGDVLDEGAPSGPAARIS